MDFCFSDDQTGLAASVRDFLDGTHGPEKLRALDPEGEGGEQADEKEVWGSLVEMGVTGLLIPEDQGGLGMTLLDGAMIALELGRANVNQPMIDTALIAAPWLVRQGQIEKLGGIVDGSVRIALAHSVNPFVADLDNADFLLDGKGLTEGSNSAPQRNVDPLRNLSAATGNASDDEDLLNIAALMTAAQLAGGATRMVELATAYAIEREQFGQPIGKFQAVKHHLSTAAVKLEFSKPVLWRAAQALEEKQSRAPVHISHAKVAASDAAMLAAETAIQIHGAMGYTYEVDLHYWLKRAWGLVGAWGDQAFHAKRISAAVMGRKIGIGPDQTFETS